MPKKPTLADKFMSEKIAYKPENKRAKQHEGQPRRRKTTYGYKVGRRNEYNVSTYSRDGKYKYQNVNAWGQDSLRTAKRVGGQRANGRAYKNVVYNRTRKHYVGPNRAR